MGSSAINTFLRLRPVKKASNYFQIVDDSTVVVDIPPNEAHGIINNKKSNWRFGFHGILDQQSTQEEVFERVALPVVNSVLEGYNGTIFAYGQTGSGKTFSLTGGVSSFAQRGIIPRSVAAIYAHIRASSEADYTVRVSYLEIYNEHGFDLLDPREAEGGMLARVHGVTEDDDGSVHLKGLSKHAVGSEEAALNLLFVGDTNRAVSETSMNAESSRSHCIFTISVESRPHGTDKIRRSKLHLVDLAGSERVGKSGASGTTLNEARSINQSLHFLEMVIMALHEKETSNRSHIPYRNSMLTSVLRDSLGGNCKTVMIATVHPAATHTDESISTCRFAQRVAQIKNEVMLNEEVDQDVLIQRLKEENRKLREGQGFEEDKNAELTAGELAQLHASVRAFLSNVDPSATLAWGAKGKRAAKVRHALWIIKALLLEGWRPKGEFAQMGGHLAAAAAAAAERQSDGEAAAGSGEVAGGGGAAGGGEVAAAAGGGEVAAPAAPRRREAWGEEGHEAAAAGGEARRGGEEEAWLLSLDGARRQLSDAEVEALRARESAFRLFRSAFAVGRQRYEALREANSAVKEQVAVAQRIGLSLRAARDAIGAVKGKIEQRRISRAIASVVDGGGGGEGDEPAAGADAEERELCAQLQRDKERYRSQAEELKGLKLHCTALQGRTQSLKAACEADFARWWPLACARYGVAPPSGGGMEAAGAGRGHGASASTSDAIDGERDDGRGVPKAEGRASGHGTPRADAASRLADEGGELSLELLQDPEAALQAFKNTYWDAGKAKQREKLKERLNDAYASAKELGELVTSKRSSVTNLKHEIAQTQDDELADRLRARLAHDTGLYKGAVGQLKEIKPEIERLQHQLQLSQSIMQNDFEEWRQTAMLRFKSTRAHMAVGGGSRDRTNVLEIC